MNKHYSVLLILKKDVECMPRFAYVFATPRHNIRLKMPEWTILWYTSKSLTFLACNKYMLEGKLKAL